jgi:16S rRNA (guanine527-N7)-methyltransferase
VLVTLRFTGVSRSYPIAGTFHVKHSGKLGGNPKEIGRETRARVENHLATVGFGPPSTGFGDRIERFAETLALWGSRINLTAHPEDPAELAFHIIDSLAPLILERRPEGATLNGALARCVRVLDLGSGAGFPGLVLAAACPAQFTLAEARRKRASFLQVAGAEMGLGNVEIEGRIKTSARFDVVLGRAFARPAIFYRAAAAALRSAGRAILFAGAGQPLDEAAGLAAGLAAASRIPYEVPREAAPARRVLAVWQRSAL